MKPVWSIVYLTILSFVPTGCGVNPPKQPRMDSYTPAQVHVDSEQLRIDTAVGTPIVSRDREGNLVHVTVPVRSAIDKTLHVDYYVTFFDRNGQVLSKLGPFEKTLQANTPDSIA